MSVPRLATLAVALSALVPASANAMDEYLRASSSKSAPIKLCGETDADRIKTALCKEQGYDKLVAQIDEAFDAVLPKAPANIRPLLKRDQAWFNEMILEAADLVVEMDDADIRTGFSETLQSRVTALESMADGIGRTGFTGRWASAFGGIVVTPAEADAYRLAVNIRVNSAATGMPSARSARSSSQPPAHGWRDRCCRTRPRWRRHRPKAGQRPMPNPSRRSRRRSGCAARARRFASRSWPATRATTCPAANRSSRSPRAILPAASRRPRRARRTPLS
jgi:hypothetical protein